MKIIVKYSLIGISFLMFNACDKDHLYPELQSNSINKILPLGASRVDGARPEFESYRYELWKDLKENNWTFDFIGTQSDKASSPTFNSENLVVLIM